MKLAINTLFLFLAISIPLTSSQALFRGEPYVQVIENHVEFQAIVLTSDWVTSYVFYSDKSDRCQMFEPVYNDFAREFHDYIKVFAINCDAVAENPDTLTFIPVCDPKNIEYLPMISFFEPPAKKFNPYTKQRSQPTEHHFQGDATSKALFNFGRKFMPAWRTTITSKAQLDQALNDDIIPSKVILFTNKPETSPLYKAISSAYRDRLSLFEVNENQSDLIKEYGITKFPTLLVVTRNNDGSLTKDYFEEDLKYDKISSFLDKFALKQKVDRPDDVTAQPEKEQEKPVEPKTKFHDTHVHTFLDDINKSEKLAMVHVYKDDEFEILKDVTEKFQSLFEYYTLDCKNEDDEKFATDVLGIKSLPALIVFPVGKNKKVTNRLHLPKYKALPEILHDISDLIEDKTDSLSPAEAQAYINDLLANKKPTHILFYESQDVSMSYRVIAQLSRYQGKMKFAKFRNPTAEQKQMFGITKLPTLVTLFLQDPKKEIEDFKNEDIKVAHFSGRFVYNELVRFVDAFLPEDEILQELNMKKKVNEAQSDFDRFCPSDAKACIVGLINGYKGTEEANNKFNETVDTLNQVFKKFPQFPFVWIDAVCHGELLIDMNIMSEMIPTLIIYNPQKKEFSQLIGQFDKNGITSYVDNYLKGRRLSYYPLPKGIRIEEKDCERVHQQIIDAEKQTGLSPEDDEILREILEEERLKREARDGGKKKKKDKKKKKYDDDL